MLNKMMLAMTICGMVGGMLFFTGCRRDAGGHPDPDRIVSEIESRLDLDAEQSARLKEMVLDLETEAIALHDEAPDMHRRIAEMVTAERLDAVELQQLYDSKREKMDRLAEKVIVHLVDFHALLTVEQRETLAARIEDHEPGRRCRFLRR